MSTPALSLVVCTRDRASRLASCLEAIGRIESSSPWELVVVDNGSQDETREIVESARERLAAPLKLIEEPTRGVSRARNAGWRNAEAAIVSYTDDDCYPSPDFVEAVAACFERDEGLGYLGGAVLPYDPADAALTTVDLREPVDLAPGGFVTPGLMISANLSFRREVLEAIGGFDIAFGYGVGFVNGTVDAVIEDADAAARASAAGWRGRYDPAVVVRHQHGRRTRADLDRIRLGYEIGRGAFFAKCAFDRRLRRRYLAGWLRLTLGRVRRRESLRPVARELSGALRYVVRRASRRVRGSGTVAPC